MVAPSPALDGVQTDGLLRWMDMLDKLRQSALQTPLTKRVLDIARVPVCVRVCVFARARASVTAFCPRLTTGLTEWRAGWMDGWMRLHPRHMDAGRLHRARVLLGNEQQEHTLQQNG